MENDHKKAYVIVLTFSSAVCRVFNWYKIGFEHLGNSVYVSTTRVAVEFLEELAESHGYELIISRHVIRVKTR